MAAYSQTSENEHSQGGQSYLDRTQSRRERKGTAGRESRSCTTLIQKPGGEEISWKIDSDKGREKVEKPVSEKQTGGNKKLPLKSRPRSFNGERSE